MGPAEIWASVVSGKGVPAGVEQVGSPRTVLSPHVNHHDYIERPAHYSVGGRHEVWDAMREWAGNDKFLAYLQLSAIKYLSRFGKKGTRSDWLADLKKAKAFIHRAIQLMELPPDGGEGQEKAAVDVSSGPSRGDNEDNKFDAGVSGIRRCAADGGGLCG